MAAMIFTGPPRFEQCSMSMPNATLANDWTGSAYRL